MRPFVPVVRRALTPLVAVLVVTFAVTACSAPAARPSSGETSPTPSGAPSSSAPEQSPTADAAYDGVPQSGDCWRHPDDPGVDEWVAWEGDAPVDCEETHDVATLAVVELADNAADAPYPGTLRGSPGSLLKTLRTACSTVGGTGMGLEAGSRVTSMYYLPSADQWADGERWARCDVALLALGPVERTEYEPLPAAARELVDDAFDAYRVCLDTPNPVEEAGPLVDLSAGTLVACGPDAQWEFGGAHTFEDQDFPGWDALTAELLPVCEQIGTEFPDRPFIWTNAPDTATQWALDKRTGTCWFGLDPPEPSGTTLAHFQRSDPR